MTDRHVWCNCEALEREITQMQAENDKLRAEGKALRNIVRHYGLMGDKQLDEVLEAAQAGEGSDV